MCDYATKPGLLERAITTAMIREGRAPISVNWAISVDYIDEEANSKSLVYRPWWMPCDEAARLFVESIVTLSEKS